MHRVAWFLSRASLAAVVAVSSACSEGSKSSATTEPSSPTPSATLQERTESGVNRVMRGSMTTVDVPGGSTFEAALDINDAGTIAGRYLTPAGTTYGYVRSKSGEFTTIQYPGAVFTVAAGINNHGDIVGHYSRPEDIQPKKPAIRHGYLLSHGVYTSFDPPGSIRTNVLGIDERGDIVGRYLTATKPTNSGFLLRHGTFTAPIDYPGATETDLWTITRRGQILGAYAGPDGNNHLFLLQNDLFTGIELPGVVTISTDKGSMSARGDIVGTSCPTSPCVLPAPVADGFLLSANHFESFDFSGAIDTSPFGINARGDIVGAYSDAQGVSHGFLFERARRPNGERHRDRERYED